jgi:hypothetical protein
MSGHPDHFDLCGARVTSAWDSPAMIAACIARDAMVRLPPPLTLTRNAKNGRVGQESAYRFDFRCADPGARVFLDFSPRGPSGWVMQLEVFAPK